MRETQLARLEKVGLCGTEPQVYLLLLHPLGGTPAFATGMDFGGCVAEKNSNPDMSVRVPDYGS